MAQSIKVHELRRLLLDMPQNSKVFLASDPEGNNFGSIDPRMSFGEVKEDGVIIMYPAEQLFDEDVMPIAIAQIEKDLKEGR